MSALDLAELRRIAESACDDLGHDWEAQGNDLDANLTSADGPLYVYMEGFAKGQATRLLPYLQTFDPGMMVKLLSRIEVLEKALAQVYWDSRSREAAADADAEWVRALVSVDDPKASEGDAP